MHVIRVNVHLRDISADMRDGVYVPPYDTRVIRLAPAILRRCMIEPPSYIRCSETLSDYFKKIQAPSTSLLKSYREIKLVYML